MVCQASTLRRLHAICLYSCTIFNDKNIVVCCLGLWCPISHFHLRTPNTRRLHLLNQIHFTNNNFEFKRHDNTTTHNFCFFVFFFIDSFSQQMLSDYDFGCDSMFSVPSKIVSFFQEGKNHLFQEKIHN